MRPPSSKVICAFITLLVKLALIVSASLPGALAQATEHVTSTSTNSMALAPNNRIGDLKVRAIPDQQSAADMGCHARATDDQHWQTITIDQLPQDQHSCLRAWISIDSASLVANPILLTGMLAAVDFYWDGVLLARNGIPGANASAEMPGVIKTQVRIPDQALTTGAHLLSAELSSFLVGRQLTAIGYLLALVDEQQLSSAILALSVVSALFIGMLFILAVIFQLIYWLYERAPEYQIFSIFCLAAALLLAVEQTKFWLDYTYDWHTFRLSVILTLTYCASLLLPCFYVVANGLARPARWALLIAASLLLAAFASKAYDTTNTLLLTGTLAWSLALNLYQVIRHRQAHITAAVFALGLVAVLATPEYFTEFGFGLFFIGIAMIMLVALIREMRVHKSQSLQAERIRTELLRRNMQPHYLMNCLTQLMELIEVKPRDALAFISALSDEFRQLTAHSNKHTVPLTDEITLCNNHLAIMSLRYQQHYQLLVTGDINGIFVPASILHSQIENCFTHNKIAADRACELLVARDVDSTTGENGQRINLTLKTPIDKKINHQGTGSGERYIKAKLAEISETKTRFASYAESDGMQDYWVSQISYPNIEG